MWFDQDVRFGDGGLAAELEAAARHLADLRDRRARLVARACADWQGGARAAFDRAERPLQDLLDEVEAELRRVRRDLQEQALAARTEQRRRVALRAQAAVGV